MSVEATAAVARIAVLIATFRRPAGLRALLASLDAQRLADADGRPIAEIGVIVVDNDAEAPLRDQGIDPATWTHHPLTYAIEPRRGVAAVRNRALELVPSDVDWVAFVDDDEVASPDWLAALLATARRFGAVAVQGPVEPAYEIPAPEWVDRCGLFRLGPYRDGEPLVFAATNNSLVDKHAIDRLGLRFDLRFNLSGGEDQDFFSRLLAAHPGGIVASAGALVSDVIPASRMTMRWVLRRSYRMGNSLGRIAMIRLGIGGRVMRALKALARVGRGAAVAILAAPLGRDPGRRGILDVAWGLGSITGLAGFEFLEYARPAAPAPKAGVASVDANGEKR